MQIDKFILIDKLTYGLRNQLVAVSETTTNKAVVINNKILEIGIISADGKTDKDEIIKIVEETDVEIIDKVLEYMVGLLGKKNSLTKQE